MSFEKMMEELKRDYVNSLPQKIHDIENHFSAADHATLQDDFHKLKGTGKTYGLPEVSELGEAVEKVCQQRPDAIAQVIPRALHLLREIYNLRRENQPFSLAGNPEYLAIRQAAGLD